jgi:FtsP/CotA-like multicopper oxidase with cupredoxin domain
MRISRRAILSGSGASLLARATSLTAQSNPSNADGFRILEATRRQQGRRSLFAYQGSVPGPILRVVQGDELRVRLLNRLDYPTTVHFHGYQLPNAMDGAAGVTQEAVASGASFDYRFTANDSGTYWYHPGTFIDRTQQIEGGLFGPLIVEERDPPAVHQELVLVVHDAPAEDGSAEDGHTNAAARPRLFVNGAIPPLAMTCAPGTRLRIRLINASAYQVAAVGFQGIKPVVAAIDGQPSDLFEPAHASVPLGPGARADIFADLAIGATPALARLVLHGDGEADRDLVNMTVQGEAVAPLPAIAPLAANPTLPADINLARAKRLDFTADASTHFKLTAGPGSKRAEAEAAVGKPSFDVKRGSAVSLGFRNLTSLVQAIHVHGHPMRLLHPLDDGWEPYWRDGFLLPPQKTSRVAFVADRPGKWVVEAVPLAPAAPIRYAFFEVI